MHGDIAVFIQFNLHKQRTSQHFESPLLRKFISLKRFA